MFEAMLPITGSIQRELISSLRNPRYFYLVLIGAFIALLCVFTLWPRPNPTPWEMSSASSTIFIFLALTLAGGAAISIPALSGSSIVTEREEDTFELLAMTSAKPWHIVVAKLANAAGHYFLLMAALAPIAASAFFLVGLNTELLWKTLLVITSTTLACAAAGVLCSCLVRKPMAAVGLSYLAMMTIVGMPLLLLLIVLELLDFRIVDQFLTHFGVYIMPVFAFAVAVDAGPTGTSNQLAVEFCSALCVLLALVCVVAAHISVRRHWGMPSELVAKSARRFGRRYRWRQFSDHSNVQYERERRFEFPLRGWSGLLIVWVPLGLSLLASTTFIGVAANTSDRALQQVYLAWQTLQAVLLPGLLIAITGNLFTKEIERSNFDALRSTLIREESLVAGKLMAALRVAGILFIMALLGTAPIFIAGLPITFRTHFYATFMLGTCLLTTWSITACCSATAKRMPSAVVASFVLSAVMMIGVAIVIIVIDESLAEIFLSNTEWWAILSPYLAGLIAASSNPAINLDEWRIWQVSQGVTLFMVLAFVVETFRRYRKRCAQDG